MLPPVHPHAGVSAVYQKKLTAFLDEMHRSIVYWVTAAWRKNPPVMAQDAPADDLRKEFKNLGKRWLKNINQGAPKLATYFAQSAKDRTDAQLKGILDKAGFTVDFVMTPAAQDAYSAVIGENVGLIRRIAQEHLADVEGLVMRSVQVGGDLYPLAKAIEERYGLTKRRAALIARDQNNKATAVITRVRQQDMGMTEAIWLHSRAGAKPRPEHVAFNGKRYNLAKGAYLEGKWVWPGTEINCRCVSKSIIPGFE